ncbi:MAG: hypothetical protein WBM28_01350 [Burkholderiales bacterium]
MATWGLPLFNSVNATWKSAYEHEGRRYDIDLNERGATYSLSKPIIIRDKSGAIAGGEFRTRREAEHAAARLVEKSLAAEVRIEPQPSPNLDFKGLSNTFLIGPDMYQLAVKICLALATLLPEARPDEREVARKRLLASPFSPGDDVFLFLQLSPVLDALRPALAHCAYVERDGIRLIGAVQFFGVFRIFCRLGTSKVTSQPAAISAVLDPVTAVETVKHVAPLNVLEPPFHYLAADYLRLVGDWTHQLRQQAVERGATNPPNLVLDNVDVRPSE